MSKYVTQENLKEITKSISEIFNIKLHRVRHKIAINEGFKNHEAHIKKIKTRKHNFKLCFFFYFDII
jgi:hypothetical protein